MKIEIDDAEIDKITKDIQRKVIEISLKRFPMNKIIKEVEEVALSFVNNRLKEGIRLRMGRLIEEIISEHSNNQLGEYLKEVYDKGFSDGFEKITVKYNQIKKK